jgi:hypothetical protein
MRKNLISILAAGFLFSVPTWADNHENRFEVNHLEPGIAIDMHDDGLIDATIVNVEDGMIWLETANKLSLVVPKSQSMWVGDRMAHSGDHIVGQAVTVEFPRDQELRVMEVNGDQVLLGSYNGVIYIPASIVSNDFDADFYTYDPSYDVED